MEWDWCRAFPARWLPIAFLAIALVDLGVHVPAWSHTVRGDHIAYLADAAQCSSWWELVSRHYSYDRSREFNHNSSELFRPLVFVLMGTESRLFGYRFVAWQLVGFALHLAVVWQLLRLLHRIRPTIAAPAFALFFSVLTMPSEQVIWHHLHGYLVFCLVFLVLLEQCWLHAQEGQTSRKRLAAIVALLVAGVFVHEAMLGVAVLAAAFLVWRDPRRGAARWSGALVAGAVIVYAAVSFADYHARGCSRTPDVAAAFGIVPTAGSVGYALTAWTAGGICPLFLEPVVGERLFLPPADFLRERVWLQIALAFAIAACAGGLAWLAWRRRAAAAPLGMLTASCLAAWAVLLSVGRLNALSPDTGVAIAPYYAYFAWLALLVTVHAFIDFPSLPRFAAWLLAILLAASTLLNAVSTRRINERYREWGRLRVEALAQAEWLLHRRAAPEELDSFRHPGDPPLPMVVYDADPQRLYRLTQLLWPEHFRGYERR